MALNHRDAAQIPKSLQRIMAFKEQSRQGGAVMKPASHHTKHHAAPSHHRDTSKPLSCESVFHDRIVSLHHCPVAVTKSDDVPADTKVHHQQQQQQASSKMASVPTSGATDLVKKHPLPPKVRRVHSSHSLHLLQHLCQVAISGQRADETNKQYLRRVDTESAQLMAAAVKSSSKKVRLFSPNFSASTYHLRL